jgi:septum formation protein
MRCARIASAYTRPNAKPGWQAEIPWYTALVEQGSPQNGIAQTPPPAAPDPHVGLHLASRSPRRRQLLEEAGLAHHSQHPGFDDSDLSPGAVTPSQWVAALAYLKAAAGAQTASPGCTVLGADTAIVKNGTLIGTPRDGAEAFRILRGLSDGTHEVVTGVALVERSTGRRMVFVDRAAVTVGHLSDAMIREYLATDAWRGKAGGYNLRERQADGWPLTHQGDPTTVMGLPMKLLPVRLEQFAGACGCHAQGQSDLEKVPA